MLTLAAEKEKHDTLHVLTTENPGDDVGVTLSIDKIGLSANNKFYMSFGEHPSFKFFKCYPVNETAKIVPSILEDASSTPIPLSSLVHPPCWGIATVKKSSYPEISVGTKFRCMLPLGDEVYFAQVEPLENGDFNVVREGTNPAYNRFNKIREGSLASKDTNETDLALACGPGIITGFGLYHDLKINNFFRPSQDVKIGVVATSASSKVSLALAFYLKQDEATREIPIVGYTSSSNVDFVKATGLYDQVLEYSERIASHNKDGIKYVLIDVAGRADVLDNNLSELVKGYVVGNSNGVSEAQSTGKKLGILAIAKMLMTFSGFTYLSSFLNPKVEAYLIFGTIKHLKGEWGEEAYEEHFEKANVDFCKEASKWIKPIKCSDLKSIGTSYNDIMNGKVPPSETIILDVKKGLETLPST